jgi:hypothetical protein
MVASSIPPIIGRQRAGWRLARDPHEITLLEVYDAVEQEPLFAMYHSELFGIALQRLAWLDGGSAYTSPHESRWRGPASGRSRWRDHTCH